MSVWRKGSDCRQGQEQIEGVPGQGERPEIEKKSGKLSDQRSIRGRDNHDSPLFYPIDGHEESSNKSNNQKCSFLCHGLTRAGWGRGGTG